MSLTVQPASFVAPTTLLSAAASHGRELIKMDGYSQLPVPASEFLETVTKLNELKQAISKDLDEADRDLQSAAEKRADLSDSIRAADSNWTSSITYRLLNYLSQRVSCIFHLVFKYAPNYLTPKDPDIGQLRENFRTKFDDEQKQKKIVSKFQKELRAFREIDIADNCVITEIFGCVANSQQIPTNSELNHRSISMISGAMTAPIMRFDVNGDFEGYAFRIEHGKKEKEGAIVLAQAGRSWFVSSTLFPYRKNITIAEESPTPSINADLLKTLHDLYHNRQATIQVVFNTLIKKNIKLVETAPAAVQ